MTTERAGLQIRFKPEAEPDLIAFFASLKKAEVHVTAVSAFRMYMRAVGFYERWNGVEQAVMTTGEAQGEPEAIPETAEADGESFADADAFQALGSMFDSENDLG